MSHHKCSECSHIGSSEEFAQNLKISKGISSDTQLPRECPCCHGLSYLMDSDSIKESLEDKVNELESLAALFVKKTGDTSDDCVLTGILNSLCEVRSRINGIEDADIIGNPESFLEMLLGNPDEYQGNMPETFVDALDGSGWRVWQENGSYSDLELELKIPTASAGNYLSINIHLTFSWDEKDVYLVFGDNLGDGFNDGASIYFDFDNKEELLGNMLNAFIENKTQIIEEWPSTETLEVMKRGDFDEDIVNGIKALYKVLAKTPN